MSRYRGMANAVIREPAEDPLEEVYRAVTEVWASTVMLMHRAEGQLELRTGRAGGVAVGAPNDPGPPDEVLTSDQVREGVSRAYEWFCRACSRSIAGIVSIDWAPLHTSPTAALEAITDLRCKFPAAMWKREDWKPGDHLLMGDATLALSARGGLNLELHRDTIDAAVAVLKRFTVAISELVDAGVSTRGSGMGSGPHPKPDEKTCWTKSALAAAIRVDDSTLRRWASLACPEVNERGKGSYLTRGEIEQIATEPLRIGNVDKGKRLQSLARV